MTVFTQLNNGEDIMSFLELCDMISNDDLHIVFGENTYEYLTEFEVRFKGDNKRVIMIRNRYLDGVNGQPIPHDPSLKYIFGREYVCDRMLGLPFEIVENSDGELNFQGKAANSWKLKDVDSTGKKIVKTLLKEDSNKMYKYWYLDPNKPDEYEEMKRIEVELVDKYTNRRF